MNLLQKHRSWEWELYDPLVGSSMLELGNKRKAGGDGPFTYKDVFISLGFRHVSVDTNGLDGALPLDLRKPLNLGTFDMVSNIGTSEHVSENDWDGQVACWRNIAEAMHVGSVLVAITPRPGSWLRHGTWYPHKEFYTELARLNGMEVERCYDSVDRGDNIAPHLRLVYARLRRVSDAPFQMPTVGMHRNKR
jgi:hypothetical protein